MVRFLEGVMQQVIDRRENCICDNRRAPRDDHNDAFVDAFGAALGYSRYDKTTTRIVAYITRPEFRLD